MPKIIENLEEEIAKKSLELFREQSYKKVSMRKIATEVGIAVGTLYNYYPNKWELYLGVFEESWKETYFYIKERYQKNDYDYLKFFLELLYQEMKKKKAVARELFRYIINNLELNEKEESREFKRVKYPDIMINQIYELFLDSIEKDYQIKLEKNNLNTNRLFTLIQTSIALFQNDFDNDQDNLNFIYQIIDSYIEKNWIK